MVEYFYVPENRVYRSNVYIFLNYTHFSLARISVFHLYLSLFMYLFVRISFSVSAFICLARSLSLSLPPSLTPPPPPHTHTHTHTHTNATHAHLDPPRSFSSLVLVSIHRCVNLWNFSQTSSLKDQAMLINIGVLQQLKHDLTLSV